MNQRYNQVEKEIKTAYIFTSYFDPEKEVSKLDRTILSLISIDSKESSVDLKPTLSGGT